MQNQKRQLPEQTMNMLLRENLVYLRRKLRIRTVEEGSNLTDEELLRLYIYLKHDTELRMWRIVMPIMLAIVIALGLMFIRF